MQKLYIVVRTDVSETSGAQRVFGAYDKRADADTQVAYLKSRMVGSFAVYTGVPA